MMRLLFFSGIIAGIALQAAPLAPPPAIRLSFTQEELKVAETGEFSCIDAPGVNNALSTPATSCAAKLAKNNVSFLWIPSPKTSKVGIASDLRGAALSPDESLLVLLERVGGSDKPNSTRVLLFNLCNNRLINGFTLEKMRLDTPFFLSGSSGMTLYAVRRTQKEFNSPSGIVQINLKDGKIEHSFDLPSEEICSVAASGKRIFFSCRGKKEIGMLENGRFSSFVPEIKNPLVAASDKVLVVFSGSEFQTCPLSDGEPEGTPDPETLPAVSAPVSLQLLEPTGAMQLIFGENGKIWFRRGSSLRLLEQHSAGIAAYNPTDRIIYVAQKKKDLIQPCLLPELKTQKGYSPLKIKPVTRASLYALFPLCGRKQCAAAVDEQGCVYILKFGKTRWHKTAVYLVENNKGK